MEEDARKRADLFDLGTPRAVEFARDLGRAARTVFAQTYGRGIFVLPADGGSPSYVRVPARSTDENEALMCVMRINNAARTIETYTLGTQAVIVVEVAELGTLVVVRDIAPRTRPRSKAVVRSVRVAGVPHSETARACDTGADVRCAHCDALLVSEEERRSAASPESAGWCCVCRATKMQ